MMHQPQTVRRNCHLAIAAFCLWLPFRASLVNAQPPAKSANTSPSPPPALFASKPSSSAALESLFQSMQTVASLDAEFQEEKFLKLLTKPLKTSGMIYFDRNLGLARHAVLPKSRKMLLTQTSLSMWDGKAVEEVPLSKSRDLYALALAFPMLLKGDRAGLEKMFAISMQGNSGDWWALKLTPKQPSLKKILSSIEVIGHKNSMTKLTVIEASGDKTVTQFLSQANNVPRSATDQAKLFRLP